MNRSPSGSQAAPDAAGARTRLKVLVMAAAVHPRLGSEAGMGWNWVRAMSEHHDLWVITGDYRDNRAAIDEAFVEEPLLVRRVRFIFLPWFWPRRNPLVRRLCEILPPLYYLWYGRWHRQALHTARKLAAETPFDLTHQLNMIGFREPGHLWKLGLPHVWGPVGGTNNAPLALSCAFGPTLALGALARIVLNTLQFRLCPRVAAAIARTAALVTATSEGQRDFLRRHGKHSVVIPEVGTEGRFRGRPAGPRRQCVPLRLAWSGRHIGSKCLPLALRALARLKGRAWTLDVIGAGASTEAWKREARALGLDAQTTWHGWVEREKAVGIMAGADALLCSSLSEASSTVILEALTLGLPIVTLDHCGMADIVTGDCGLKVSVGLPGETIVGFSRAVERLLEEPELLPRLSEGALKRAEELRWRSLAMRMDEVYRSALAPALAQPPGGSGSDRAGHGQSGGSASRTSNGGGMAVQGDSWTRVPVLGFGVDALDMDEALARVLAWAKGRESRYVCFCNAHMAVTARTEATFAPVLAGADLVLPDGMPVALTLRRKGRKGQQRVAGPDFMLRCCARAASEDVPVYFYGSTEETLLQLVSHLERDYPGLRIAGAFSPPFRPLSEEEEAEAIAAINASGAGLVFMGLGCPKQEIWMSRHSAKINAVLLGVGAAFDFAAGTKTRAPLWMQRHGLEWLYRLMQEPGRLWRRNLVTNSLFLYFSLKEASRL